MSEQNKKFNYKYSASQQREIEKIRSKYIEENYSVDVDKMAKLRSLDAGVSKKSSITAITIGVISTLIMGCGMSFVMTDIGDKFGIQNTLVWGIVIGVVGMVGVLCAYPVYRCVLKKEKRRVSPQILKLADDLLDE